LNALESGDYDAMSDDDWVKLCERAAKQGLDVDEEPEAESAAPSM
jgi:hypothetical protein